MLGGTGLIGGHAARALLHAGATVRILTRDPSNVGGLRGGPIEVMQGDAQQREPLRRAIEGCRYIVHPPPRTRGAPLASRPRWPRQLQPPSCSWRKRGGWPRSTGSST
ncbi:MAG: NAD(P)H-binding protein [Candidatus Eisenbacteria bacterium]|nr:NAD(P)H-binding protein [Candidatus Eisenbacteria bacterium]